MAEIFNFYVQDNRSIQFPKNNLLEPIMQEDYKVATWRFRIPKTLNGIDMSGWAWWFVYTNAKNEKFSELLTLVDDIDEPDSFCTADYDIDYGISYNPGSFSFSLEAINAESGGAITGEWHTKTYAHKVDKTLQGNQAQWAETESDIISALIIEVQNKVAQLVGGATPEPKNLVADMTEPKKVYLYVGNEENESNGYWYYHNGTRFVPGGLYAGGITVDAVPTQGSNNAVSSGGVYSALDTLQAQIPQIDPTLSQSGQAADAKVVGDKISELKADLEEITGNEVINSWTMQRYIKTDVDPINISNPVVNSAYAYVVIPCADGDEFTLTGTGAVAAGLWTFINSSGYKLDQSATNAVATNLVLTAPTNSAYLVINVKPVNDYFVCKGDFLQKRISDIEEKILYDTVAILNSVSGYVRSDTGGVVSSTVYKYATLYTIPNQKIIYNGGFNGNALTSLCFYTADGKYISNSSVLTKNYDQEITTPENAYIIKATIADASHTGYIKYGTDSSVVSKLGELSTIDANNSTVPKVVLPKESVAIIGHEWNMYYENVILGLTDAYYVVCRCTGNGLGRTAYKDCLRFTPSSGEQGTYTVYIEVYSKRTQALIDSGSFTLRVIADTAVTGKKAIFIGDSLTDDGVYPAEIQYNLSHGGIVSVGTINEDITYGGQTYNVKHEGRGGWTTTNYMTAQSVSGVNNPFYNPSTKTFDFSYYMNQNGFSSVDLVSIYLGTNADTSFDVTIENLNAMIESIHDYDANIKILINTFHEAAGQDGCGNHNGLLSSQVLRNTRLNNTRLLLDEYESNNHANVYPTTLYFNVDGEHDYSTIQQKLSSRNPEVVTRQNNNVHPSVYGYLKFADSIYNQMLYLLA